MGERRTRAVAGGIAATAGLGAVAGYVDAICFGHLFDVFPANQSGNAIFLGIAIGDGSSSRAWRPAIAMLGFAIGVAAAVAVRAGARAQLQTRLLLLLEIVVLAVVAAVVGNVTDVDHLLSGVRAGALLLATSIAMGVQTEVVRAQAGVTISTTYQTGALAHIAEDVGSAATHRSEQPRGAARTVGVLFAVLVSYIAGAAFGARLVAHWGGVFVVPIVALVGLLATAPRWSPAAAAEPPPTRT